MAKAAGNSTSQAGMRGAHPSLPPKQVNGLCEIGDANVAGQRGVLPLESQKHLPGHAAIAEVPGGAGAEFRDVLGFGKVHLEQAAHMRVASGSR
jgi:hypothetical protein